MPDDPPALFPRLGTRRASMWRSVLVVAATVLVGGLAYGLLPMRGDWGYLGAAAAVAAQLTLIPLTIRRARAIQHSPTPVATAVEAIVFLLSILVFGFSTAYVVLSDEANQMVGLETKTDSLYFTITTLATVGYGDIHASGQIARVVASVQMLFDLVFLAVVVRLMTTIARRRLAEDRDD